MKHHLIILLFLFSVQFSAAQIIDLDGERFDCDSAYTNYELGVCSNYIMEQSEIKYNNTLNAVLRCLDTLIVEDKIAKAEFLKEDSTQNTDLWTDYVKIKKMIEESNKLFLEHANLEMEITGEFYGLGRERFIAENLRMAFLYDERTKELKQLLESYCNYP